MASQTRPSLWRRPRLAVAQEDRVCTCFTRNAAEDCTPLRHRSSLTHHFERSGVEALRDHRRSRVGPRLARTVPRETHWPLFLSRPTTGTSHRTCGYPLTYPLHASVLDRGAPDRLAADARAEPVPDAERPVMALGFTGNKPRTELRSSGLAGLTRRTVPSRGWF